MPRIHYSPKQKKKTEKIAIYSFTVRKLGSERVTEQANEQMSKRANGRASGPLLTSGFLVVLAHSSMERGLEINEIILL